MQFNEDRKEIILLGSGYTTVWAYRSLMKEVGAQVRNGAVRITVVSPTDHHSFHGFSGETVGGIIREEHRRSPLSRIMKHARHIRATAVEVDSEWRRVKIRYHDSQRVVWLDYDHVVVGVGSRDATTAIPGALTYGLALRGPEGAERLRRHVMDCLERAEQEYDPETRRRLLTFVVAGGGFTGVEITAAIAELLKTAARNSTVLRLERPGIILAHSGQTLLPQLAGKFDRLLQYSERTLRNAGVELKMNVRVTEVTSTGARLSDGTFIHSESVVVTVPPRPVAIPGLERITSPASGRLRMKATLQTIDQWNIWAGGDGAEVIHYRTGLPCPANALWAIKHGEHIGRNLGRLLNGKPLKSFAYPGLGQAASLGVGKGINELHGIQVTGVLSWLMRLFFFLYFYPDRRTMLKAVGDWLRLPFRGRNMNGSGHAPAPLKLREAWDIRQSIGGGNLRETVVMKN